MAVAQAILQRPRAWRGEHFRVVAARDARRCDVALAGLPQRAPAGARGRGRVRRAGRQAGTLELAIDHLLPHGAGAARRRSRCRRRRSPFGSLEVDTDACTLCLSCVGACPEAALADNPEQPQLRFIEKNCVQCGLCATTCPEDAITLEPRLCWPTAARRASSRACSTRPSRSLHPLRQALRHAAGDRGDGRASWPATRCSRARRRAAEDVQRLPRDRHPHQPRRSEDHRPVSTRPSAALELQHARRRRGTRARRGLRPARPACSMRRPTPSCYAQLQVARDRGARRRRVPGAQLGRAGRRVAAPVAADGAATSTTRCSAASASPRCSCSARYYLAGYAQREAAGRAAPRPAPRSASSGPTRVIETEDHIASLCEVMRYLIAGDDVGGQQPRGPAALLQRAPARLGRRALRRGRRAPEGRLLPRARRLRARFLRGRGAGVRSARC